jgi:glycerol-3-phosphate cytidylyltransferase
MPGNTTGYLFGIFDLFHIGHLDTIRQAAAQCDRLIVGVASDDLVEDTCGVRPFVPSIERVEIVAAVRVVAEVRALSSLDLKAEVHRVGADVVFAPGDELDRVQLALLNDRLTPPATWLALRLTHLISGRRTASSQLSAALAGSTTRSSVA